MEAVCILLGVKADWNTAKVMLADPTLIQKVQLSTTYRIKDKLLS
jgi:hypothetical protein